MAGPSPVSALALALHLSSFLPSFACTWVFAAVVSLLLRLHMIACRCFGFLRVHVTCCICSVPVIGCTCLPLTVPISV